MDERPGEEEPPNPLTPAPPATSPNPSPTPVPRPATLPAGSAGQLSAPLGAELAEGGSAAAAATATSEYELSGEDAAPEQLDWGSIDDEDGAFGQIYACTVMIQVEDPELPELQATRKGKSFDGVAPGSSPGMGSALSPPILDAAGESTCITAQRKTEDALAGGAPSAAQLGKCNGGDPARSVAGAGGASADGDRPVAAAFSTAAPIGGPSGVGATTPGADRA